jgi:TetR/AcrR family transcriptional regulator, lmrAB and yxaGH operons repressor
MAVLVKSDGRIFAVTNDTRSRMIDAAVGALRRHGVAGMSFTDILHTSGAARGAIYHHFPGGKAELVAAAASRNGGQVRAALGALPPATSPAGVIEEFLAAVRPVIAAAATGEGCAVAAVTVDPASKELCGIAADAFDSWTAALGTLLTDAGAEPGAAADLATTLITLLEGAQVLCRAAGTTEPFERTARAARDLVRSRYPDPAKRLFAYLAVD